MPDSAVRQLDDELQVVLCPECGYSLEGLPTEGTCPECGGAYDQRAIILHGWGCGSHADLGNAAPARLGMIGFSAACGVFGATQIRYRFAWATPIAVWAAGATLIEGVLLLWQRLANRRPGLVQVRLDAHGCAQTDGSIDPSTPAILRRAWHLLHWPTLVGCVAVMVAGLAGTSAGTGVIMGALAGATVLLVAACLRLMKNDAPAPVAWINYLPRLPGPPRAAKWRDVGEVRVEPVKSGRRRLRITLVGSKTSDQFAVVDAEVPITGKQAELLALRIDTWRHQAPVAWNPNVGGP